VTTSTKKQTTGTKRKQISLNRCASCETSMQHTRNCRQ
jgi:hypothetical protein